jgi:hypothetical protein
MSTNSPKSGLDISEAFDVIDRERTEALLKRHEQNLAQLPADADPLQRANIELDIASDLLALERHQEAWATARQVFDTFIEQEQWQQAVECCDVMYQCEQDDSLVALGHGVWLSVTYPVDPQTTVTMLQHVIDETPDNSDGAAVAAVVAHYIADIRSGEEQHESLTFLTNTMIAQVAKRHSQVDSQELMDFWIERMDLKDPAVFIPRLGKVIDLIVGDKWWIDRDALRERLPEN